MCKYILGREGPWMVYWSVAQIEFDRQRGLRLRVNKGQMAASCISVTSFICKFCPQIFAWNSHKYLLKFHTNICSNFTQIFGWVWQTGRATAGQQGPDGRILHLGHILYLANFAQKYLLEFHTNICLNFTQIFAQISYKYLLKFHAAISI